MSRLNHFQTQSLHVCVTVELEAGLRAPAYRLESEIILASLHLIDVISVSVACSKVSSNKFHELAQVSYHLQEVQTPSDRR